MKWPAGILALAIVAAVGILLWGALYHPGLSSAVDSNLAEEELDADTVRTERSEVVKVSLERGDWLRATFPGISLIGVYQDEFGAYIHIAFQSQEQLDAALNSGMIPSMLDGARVVVENQPIRVTLTVGGAA